MKVRRRKKPSVEAKDDEKAEAALEDFLNQPVKPKRSKRKSKRSSFDLAVSDARVRAGTGDWEDAKPRVFVGLYAVCHELVYGLLPEELRSEEEMRKAQRVARRILDTHFEGDPESMVEFIKWVWEDQKRYETWAIRNGRTGKRMSVWLQFSGSKVTDYRKALIDRKRRKR